jgi:hypothetical protein
VVNIKTKQIITLDAAVEKVYYGKVMKQFIEHILNGNYNLESVLSDDFYSSNKNFKYQKKKTLLGIKFRQKSIISYKNNKVRVKAAIS